MDADILRIQRAMHLMSLSTDHQVINGHLSSIKQLDNLIDEEITLIKAKFLGNNEYIEKVFMNYNDWKNFIKSVISAKKHGQDAKVYTLLATKRGKHVKVLSASLKNLTDYAYSKANDFYKKSQEVSENTTKSSFIVVSLATVLFIFIAILFSKGMIKTIGGEPILVKEMMNKSDHL